MQTETLTMCKSYELLKAFWNYISTLLLKRHSQDITAIHKRSEENSFE